MGCRVAARLPRSEGASVEHLSEDGVRDPLRATA